VQKPGTIVIAAHTHHPAFPSPERFALLAATYDELRHQPEAFDPEMIERMEADLAFAQAQEQPCYINTGCCSFSDGSLTAIEIDSGEARLVRWSAAAGHPQREILASARLKEFLREVAGSGTPVDTP